MIGDDTILKSLKIRTTLCKDIYNATRYTLQKIIDTKRAAFENKLIQSTSKPKDLWKVLRSLEMPRKTSSCEVRSLKIKNTVEHDVNSVLEGFKNYYLILFRKLNPLPFKSNSSFKTSWY